MFFEFLPLFGWSWKSQSLGKSLEDNIWNLSKVSFFFLTSRSFCYVPTYPSGSFFFFLFKPFPNFFLFFYPRDTRPRSRSLPSFAVFQCYSKSIFLKFFFFLSLLIFSFLYEAISVTERRTSMYLNETEIPMCNPSVIQFYAYADAMMPGKTLANFSNPSRESRIVKNRKFPYVTYLFFFSLENLIFE